jgi:large subunit ribosomal protein L15
MRLNELGPVPGSRKDRKRVGRGTGSGQGKTSGRGHKGANARSGAKKNSAYEGGQMPLQRRLPRLKGMARGLHTTARPKVYAPVNVGELAELDRDEVGVEELKVAGVVRRKDNLVKILGDGEIERAVTVRVHAFSKAAKEKIEAVGGKVEVLDR